MTRRSFRIWMRRLVRRSGECRGLTALRRRSFLKVARTLDNGCAWKDLVLWELDTEEFGGVILDGVRAGGVGEGLPLGGEVRGVLELAEGPGDLGGLDL